MRFPVAALLVCAGLAAFRAGDAHGQTLLLKRELPAIEWAGCPPATAAPPAPDSQRRAEAEALALSAVEAALLGDNERALEELTRAAQIDSASASIAYRRARALEALARTDDAVAEYCRYLGLPGAVDADDVTQRLAALTRADSSAVPAPAAEAFRRGLDHHDAGRIGAAEVAFGVAVDNAPGWAAALYNRGVVRLEMGQNEAGSADLRRYLELSPRAADFDAVIDALGSLRVARTYSPGTALATGLLVPGLGHFTTGRPVTGALVLGAAAGAVAVGVLVERTEVDCLAIPVDGRCPPDQVLRERVERPYLGAAIAAAAAIAIGGAIDAYRGARRAGDAPIQRVGGPDGPALLTPDVRPDGDVVRLDFLRLRF